MASTAAAGFLDGVSKNFDCENGLSTQHPAGKNEPSQRKKYALICSVTIALGALTGIVGFFMSENQSSPNAAIISFDLGCIKGHLDAQDGDRADIFADCEVTQNRLYGLSKYMAVPTYPGLRAARAGSVKSDPQMVGFPGFGNAGGASPTKPLVKKNARPLSPGSNYPGTKNIQKQANGFGTWLAPFQKTEGRSKYGMPVFLPNGNINPAFLAAERKAAADQKKANIKATGAKVKKLIATDSFELSGYIKKKIGEVGSGKEYYQSGK
jgi:hypothetical protein